jgi:HSP20 family protein
MDNRNHMKLMKWEPFNELDHIFDDRFLQPFTPFSKLGFDLAVDVYEENNAVVAKMSLPGVKSEELDVSIEDDILTITGRREEENEVDKKDYYSKEIRRGSFSRSVNLPKSVDATKTEAKYVNGELAVSIPIVAGKKENAIKVKVK